MTENEDLVEVNKATATGSAESLAVQMIDLRQQSNVIALAERERLLRERVPDEEIDARIDCLLTGRGCLVDGKRVDPRSVEMFFRTHEGDRHRHEAPEPTYFMWWEDGKLHAATGTGVDEVVALRARALRAVAKAKKT